MPQTTSFMTLTTWASASDYFDHIKLADNFIKIDAHDHSTGAGVQIPTGGLQDGGVTLAKLAANSVDATKLTANSVDATKIVDGAVTTAELANAAVTAPKLAPGAASLADPLPDVTSLPGAPVNGQVVTFNAANGVTWPLRYRTASASAYKWEALGAIPIYNRNDAVDTTGSTSYVALGNAVYAVAPLAGDYIVDFGAQIDNNASAPSFTAYVSVVVGGAIPGDTDAISRGFASAAGSRDSFQQSRTIVLTGVGAGASIQLRYRVDAASANFSKRWIAIRPIRLG